MKCLLLFVLITISSFVFSQDLIITKKGQEIECTIAKITDVGIIYQTDEVHITFMKTKKIESYNLSKKSKAAIEKPENEKTIVGLQQLEKSINKNKIAGIVAAVLGTATLLNSGDGAIFGVLIGGVVAVIFVTHSILQTIKIKFIKNKLAS